MRRLPVYIVVDTSESMIGKGIEDVNRGLDSMLSSLRRNPYALETVWLSVITFDSTARAIVPLTELCEFKTPRLKVRPGTSLGMAITLLQQQLSKEVELATSENKGDWRPIVFFLTDGQPTDEWRPALERLRATRPKPANIYAIGCSDEVDYALLNELGDATFKIDSVAPDAFAQLFIWMSSAVQSASAGVAKNQETFDDPALPKGVERVGDDYPAAPDYPLQIFIHSTCSQTRKKYLMRLRYDEKWSGYAPVATHPLPEDFFSEGNYTPPPIPASQVLALSPCPFCGAEGWGQCGRCQTGFCVPTPAPDSMVCPSCDARLGKNPNEGEDENNFEIARSSG